MEQAELINQLYVILINAAILGGLPLIAATIFGLIISIFQAVTQIQDQSLPQTIKIVVITFTFLSFGSLLASPFVQSCDYLFTNFHKLIR